MSFLSDILILSLRDPRAGMRRILDLRPSTALAMAALALMAVASAMLIHFGIALMPEEDQQVAGRLFGTPFTTAGLQFAALFCASLLIWQVGRWRHGQGNLSGALLTMAWCQAIMLVLQLLQIVLSLAIPPLALVVGYAAIAVFFALLSHFVAELHGFRSVGSVFLGIILTLFAMVVILSFFLSQFIDPEMLSRGL